MGGVGNRGAHKSIHHINANVKKTLSAANNK